MKHPSNSFAPLRDFFASLREIGLGIFVAFSISSSAAETPNPTPLTPEDARKSFSVPADLQIDQLLAEPEIMQPVFINFDERGRMWVVEYRQYPMPAGLKIVSRDAVWRNVYDKTPRPPPNHVPGKDRITVHEDTHGTGVYDKHTVFLDGLNIVTAVERGRGGVWLLNPPYLLFYPDKNNDDIPDGPPEVHLEGFGMEDTHSVINSLRWGPDGWLYAAQGSTVTGRVKRFGADDKEAVNSLGQLIWRYHPETRRYEIFAEGGGNTFGVELDSKGRIFSGHNGGDTRGFHYVQGGYSQKGFDKHGPLSNPYAFGYFPQMPHEKVARFSHTFLTYEGGAFPSPYNGRIFAADPIHGVIWETEISQDGSTFRTKDLAQAVTSTDKWFRPVDVKLGPDGAIYIADWYDGQIAHLHAHEGAMDASNGRIYRLQMRGAEHAKPQDLGRKTSAELVELLRSENRWTRQTALRLLGDRRDPAVIPQLAAMLENESGQSALEALWALYQSGGWNQARALKALVHTDAFVRLWAVRLLCDERRVSPGIESALIEAAQRETNVEARNQLACSARRLPAADALPLVRALLAHNEDFKDPQIPLLLWWAIESKCKEDRGSVFAFFSEKELWQLPIVRQQILERIMRRWAARGSREEWTLCARLFKLAPDADATKRLLTGFEKAFEGRTIPPLPAELMEALAKAGGDSPLLDLRLGKPGAAARALASIQDTKTHRSTRLALVQVLGEIHTPECVPVLLTLIESKDAPLAKAALTALQQYPDEAIADTLLKKYSSLEESARPVAQLVLASRTEWALALLQTVEKGNIDRTAIARETVDKLRQHDDEKVVAAMEKLFGKPREVSTAVITPQMRESAERIAAKVKDGGDPKKGHALFAQRCGACLAIFGQGGRVGPDLTSFKRDDLNTMLLNIINPSAEIREGFENFMIKTKDGRRLTGILAQQDKQLLVLRGADGQETSIPREQIEIQKPLKQSLMPEGILDNLSDAELQNLFAFLRSTQPPK
jgi:putative membrane-bound dehydrogenase-like protein